MSKIEEIAKYIKSERTANNQFKILTGHLCPENAKEAYLAQYEYHRISGRGSISGYKIALSSKVIQDFCGINNPIAGGLFADEIFQTPHKLVAKGPRGLGLEFELAIKVGKDIKPGQNNLNETTAKEYIDWVAPAFEMISDRDANYSKLDPLTMIADNAWSAGVVIGSSILSWRDLDFTNLKASLTWNSEFPLEANIMASDPFASFAWVVNLVTSFGKTVYKGNTIITGSVLKTRTPKIGDKIKYEIDKLSKVEIIVV